jgi:hypothetical protein
MAHQGTGFSSAGIRIRLLMVARRTWNWTGQMTIFRFLASASLASLVSRAPVQ